MTGRSLTFPVALLFVMIQAHAGVPAFPGVEGAGSDATGGRGGKVVHVTNLRADGPGSFQEAVSEPNRIVVFDVSGTIELAAAKKSKGGKIEIAQPNITIAGQTAPGEGICLKGGALHIGSSNVIVRYLRVRRGFNHEGDSGDAIEVKPAAKGAATQAAGQTQEALDKRMKKKLERGKQVNAFEDLNDIVIDHCSASWATDENMTVTHTGRSTISFGIAAEGLDYTNPKQTPPNHSEGSLWGSSAPDGRSTMHHMLYAHNRLRNPRTVAGADVPPVLTFYNNVVYDWSEYPTHTGSERVHLQWVDNYYKPGPSTPADIRSSAFQFHGDPQARVYASGNIIDGDSRATMDNRLAVGYHSKLGKLTDAERAAMIASEPWTALPARQTAAEAFATVVAECGATLPARDSVDLRIAHSARDGTGRVIEKETDLPEEQRWPEYHSLTPPQDSDGDGIPDAWELRFGLNAKDSADSAAVANGYANVEHYFNNTDPLGQGKVIVYVSASVSRAIVRQKQAGEWRIARTGSTGSDLNVKYNVGGTAIAGKDFKPLSGSVVIPKGQTHAVIVLEPLAGASDHSEVVLSLESSSEWVAGCPAQSLVVIRQ